MLAGRRARMRAVVVTGAVVAAAIAPIYPLFLAGGLLSAHGYYFWQPFVSPGALGELVASWIAGVRTAVPWLAPALALPAILAVRAPHDRRLVAAHLALLYAGLVAFIAVAALKPVWQARYVVALLPFFVAGLALRRRASWVFVALAVVGVVLAKARGPVGEDWRGVAALAAAGGRVIIAGPAYLRRPLAYYRSGPIEAVEDRAALVDRVVRAARGGPVFVVYPDGHLPSDPERTSVAELAQRLELRAETDLRHLHVVEIR